MKKLLFLLTLLCVSLSAWAYDFTVGGIYYNITSSTSPYKVAVTFATSSYNSYTGNVTIPSTVINAGKTYTVTSIDIGAFKDCIALTSVTIPTTVTSIDLLAFVGCSALTSVTIPSSVTSIADYTFSSCSKLTSVTIPSSVTTIGSYAFNNCSALTSVTIPSSVTTIGSFAFNNCSALTSVTIPSSVTTIGSSAFNNCSALTSVTILSSVISIADYTFSSCSKLTSVTIPSTVTSIGNGAFEGCRALASVTIPASVTTIGSSAFSGCSALTSVTIPSSVTSIGVYAFINCSSLTKITSRMLVLPTIGTSIFNGLKTASCQLIVPPGKLSLYKAATQWNSFTNITEGTFIVTTTAPTSVSKTTATSGGSIDDDWGYAITARGVCWDVNIPSISTSKTSDGTGTGTFSSSITGLSYGTTYSVRAYVTNSLGTFYGQGTTFTTYVDVYTNAITSITATTASSGGYVTAAGTTAVPACGVCWNTASNPTIANSKTSIVTASGTFKFVSSLTGLTPNTTYYLRAWASNAAGISYGSEISFTTLSPPILGTSTVNKLSNTFAEIGNNVSLTSGSSSISARGVCWATTANPTVANNKTTDGTGTGQYSSTITGLTKGTTYHARAYATNNEGTAYGNDISFTTLSNDTQVYLKILPLSVWRRMLRKPMCLLA